MFVSADISTTVRGAVNHVNSDWNVQVDAIPHSPLIQNGSTGVVNFTAPTTRNSVLAMNDSSTFTVTTTANDADPGINVGGTVKPLASPYRSTTGTFPGVIDSVSVNGGTTTYTQGTPFTQFATNDIDIPWVSSGSVIGALDLCWQLAGNRRCTLTYPGGRYWSLRGHDTGFDSAGKIFYPADYSTYKMTPTNDGTIFRNWDLRDSAAVSQWAASGTQGAGDGTDLFGYRITGSSPTVVAGTRTSIAFNWSTSTNSLGFYYGTTDKVGNYATGPWTGINNNMGKVMSFVLSGSNKNVSIYYYWITASGGAQQLQPTVDLSSLDLANTAYRLKVVTDTAWIDNHTFQWTIWFQDHKGARVSWTSGPLSTDRDAYAKPWTSVGAINGLYQITSPLSFDPTVLLANYENPMSYDAVLWGATDNGGLPPLGSLSYEPILPFTGSLWDYLCQVCCAKEIDLRYDSTGKFILSKMSDLTSAPQNWYPIADPTLAVDNQNVASTVEVDAQLIALRTNPQVYDARYDGNQVYSFNAGQTSTFTINSTFIGSTILNPQPAYLYSDYATNSPFGGFIVSGADNLPITVSAWINYGGSVLVRQTGSQTLEVTVNCPQIWIANGDGGSTPNSVASYSFSVSDGQNSHATLSLVGLAGDTAKPVTRTFQTGAAYAGNNSTPGAIVNPAASSLKMVNTIGMQAASIASGPNLTLSGTIPLENLELMYSSMGSLPGTNIYYANIAWRILSCTFAGDNVQFTAMPLMTYGGTPAWATNWSGATVDDFTQFWAGRTYDDMKTVALMGHVSDWGALGATARGTLYPNPTGGAEQAIYPGAETYPGGDLVD